MAYITININTQNNQIRAVLDAKAPVTNVADQISFGMGYDPDAKTTPSATNESIPEIQLDSRIATVNAQGGTVKILGDDPAIVGNKLIEATLPVTETSEDFLKRELAQWLQRQAKQGRAVIGAREKEAAFESQIA